MAASSLAAISITNGFSSRRDLIAITPVEDGHLWVNVNV
jgi:hypothetical protein